MICVLKIVIYVVRSVMVVCFLVFLDIEMNVFVIEIWKILKVGLSVFEYVFEDYYNNNIWYMCMKIYLYFMFDLLNKNWEIKLINIWKN